MSAWSSRGRVCSRPLEARRRMANSPAAPNRLSARGVVTQAAAWRRPEIPLRVDRCTGIVNACRPPARQREPRLVKVFPMRLLRPCTALRRYPVSRRRIYRHARPHHACCSYLQRGAEHRGTWKPTQASRLFRPSILFPHHRRDLTMAHRPAGPAKLDVF